MLSSLTRTTARTVAALTPVALQTASRVLLLNSRLSSTMSRKITPLSDRVLVERLKPEAKTVSGILLPEQAVGKVNEGKVLAVGPGGRKSDGTVIPMSVKKGDKVLLPEYGGMTVKIDDQELVIFHEDDILGILE